MAVVAAAHSSNFPYNEFTETELAQEDSTFIFFFLFTRYLLFMDRQCISYPSFWKLLFSSDILRGILFVGLKWKISASCVVCWEVAIWCETEAKRLLMDLSVEAVTLSPPSWH